MTDEATLLEQANNELQAGRLADSEASARQVLTKNPDNGPAWHIAGLAVLRQGRSVEAVRNLMRATELDDANAMLWMHLGIAQGMASDMSASIESLRTSIARNPDLVTAYLNLGLTLTNAGRLTDAESVYRDALARTPAHAGALEGLGNTLLAQDRPDDAIDAFERAQIGRAHV